MGEHERGQCPPLARTGADAAGERRRQDHRRIFIYLLAAARDGGEARCTIAAYHDMVLRGCRQNGADAHSGKSRPGRSLGYANADRLHARY